MLILLAEVLDLTHPANVELFRRWDQTEVAYIKQLRFIRITSESPDLVAVSRPGRHPSLSINQKHVDSADQHDQPMDTDDEVPLLMEPPSRFASTIMTMDGSAS